MTKYKIGPKAPPITVLASVNHVALHYFWKQKKKTTAFIKDDSPMLPPAFTDTLSFQRYDHMNSCVVKEDFIILHTKFILEWELRRYWDL